MQCVSYGFLGTNEVKTYFDSLYQTITTFTPGDEYSPQSLEDIFSNMLDGGGHILGALADERIVGLCALRIEWSYLRGCIRQGHLGLLAVDKGWSGQGIGSALVAQMTQYAKDQGWYKVVLECDERLAGFYKKQGYVQKEVSMKKYVA